jgi:pimeloyl-ACP methyl ester carboxylesterase
LHAIQSEPDLQRHTTDSPIVVLGGYSYGSLILKHLPPLPTLLAPFATPILGSARDEILLRAHKLADQSNNAWLNRARSHERERERRSRRNAHEVKASLTMGGEETTPEKRRTSRDVRRSVDRGLSVDLGSRLRSLSHRGRKDESLAAALEKADTVPITVPEIRYLLISPLTPPISTVLAPILGHKFWNKARGGEEVIGRHATLAIYGDNDMFTSAKRIREWSEQLQAVQGSQFSSVEVVGAGHFWVEHGVEEKLRAALGEWEGDVR